MRCPKCQSETRIVNSRYKHKGNFTYRRRECLNCQFRFSTKEILKEGFVFMDYAKVTMNIRKELEKYIMLNDIKSLVIGVSGGIDSAVCCALAKPVCEKLEIPLIGRSIPIESNRSDELRRAKNIGDFCSEFLEADFSDLYRMKLQAYEALEGTYDKIARGNLKARTRMEYLYSIAGKQKGLVLSTDNYTEYLLGFWTLHGDVGDFGQIQMLWKSEVYSLAEYLRDQEGLSLVASNALTDCIDAVPTDGLGITNSDLDQIFPEWNKRHANCRDAYTYVDQMLMAQVQMGDNMLFAEGLSDNPVIKRHKASQFKRDNPYNITRNILES